MAKVHLRKITPDNFHECISLKVDEYESQKGLIASKTKSLAEAYVNSNLFPLAIYNAAVMGYEQPQLPMVGFTMYEIVAGIGFIMRLMVDRKYHRKGYGRAAMQKVIRRLKLYPEVELIATSYHRGNETASKLYHSLGFVDWEIEWALNHKSDTFVKLEL